MAVDPKFGLIKAINPEVGNRDQLILLESHPDTKGIDHDFQSPTFEEVIRKRIAEFIDKYGE